ncbi:MAG: hypothetical protein HZA78_01210 [Candidatus Schekmanbacteria bacterium]|nr:hypothetical protein [Candidatus Schekmanbacteria bacterium]
MSKRKALTLFVGLSLILAVYFALFGQSGITSVSAEEHAVHAVKQGQPGHNAAASHNGAHEEHHSQIAGPVTAKISWTANLPLWAILLPLIGGLIAVSRKENDKQRNCVVVGTCTLTMLLLILMYGPVVNGISLNGKLYQGIYCAYKFLPGFDFTFRVDAAALTVAYVTNFLWILSGIYAIGYMTIEENRTRYDYFMLSALGANLGVLLTGDFLSLFFFFEGLILFPYSLVAHKEDPGALRGANLYLYLGVISSLTLLTGITLFYKYTGTVNILPISDAAALRMTPATKYIIAVLMIIGFGGKAGVFLEHIWLPAAHPVAPTPASALLSGAMIKAGAYGIFRVVCLLFLPKSFTLTQYLKQWATMSNIGYAVIWVGIVSMFLAVLAALITANSKRMLAFHSVSQMGYIVMGIGCAAYMGSDGAMGLAGSIYHMVNHALFKCALFLGVGAMYYRTHELDMYKLGGMRKNMPIVALGLFIAACGIAGIPCFNGFASKTLLHHAILEAYDHSAHLGGGVKDYKLKLAEIIFMITAGGTFASNMKLFALTCLGKRPEKYADVEAPPRAMHVAIILVSFAILFIGLRPNWMLETLIGPALAVFGFNPGSHAYHMIYNVHAPAGLAKSTIPILYLVGNGAPDALAAVIHNLLGGGTAIMLGGMYFILGMRFGWFHIEVPGNCQFGYYYEKVYHLFKRFCCGPVAVFDRFVYFVIINTNQIYYIFRRLCTGPVAVVDSFVDSFIVKFMLYLWFPLADMRSALAKWDKYILPRAWKERGPWQPYTAKFYIVICKVFAILDSSFVDGIVNVTAEGVSSLGSASRRTQTGFFQHYALAMISGVLLIIILCLMAI